MGPFLTLSSSGSKSKVYILVFSCTWSRAINLEVCLDLSVSEFLRGFQIHCFKYGVPSACTSDLGSQLTAGANILKSLLGDSESRLYLEAFGIEEFS